MKVEIATTTLELLKGDITEVDTEAIVNAANSHLRMGGGVAGAIRRKGGPKIQEECDRIGPIKVGGATLTTGGRLRSSHVIHAVGPRMGDGDEERKLRDATLNALKLAEEHGLKSIAFPAISTGIFGYPMETCAKVMLSAVLGVLESPTCLQRIVFCLYDQAAYATFEDELERQLQRPG
jgi:O-acetyl-ADP-ribose deacetylase (regulator of RNase III)